MKKALNFILFGLILLMSASPWAAEKMKEATEEYSADMVIEAGGVSTTGKIYHALGGKDRMEMTAQGSTSVTITRIDKKIVWMLMPEQKMYMEMSIEESAQNNSGTSVSDCDMDFSSLGDETVNGIKTKKNKVSGTCPNNVKYDGTMWITKDNIMVKMDAVTTVDGKQSNVKMDLKNLKTGKQNASLFEIPAGYQKFNMGSMSSMFNAAQGQAAQNRAQPIEEADEDYGYESSETGQDINPVDAVDNAADETNKTLDTTDKVKDTVNRLKGLFGK